jgi:hypothetical protein
MKNIGIVALVSMVAALVVAPGCGNGGGESCDVKASGTHVCVTYDSSVDSSAVSAACMASAGTLGDCPTASKLGSCALTAGGLKETESFYSDTMPAITADEAKMACTSAGGTWTAGM